MLSVCGPSVKVCHKKQREGVAYKAMVWYHRIGEDNSRANIILGINGRHSRTEFKDWFFERLDMAQASS